MQSSKAFCNSVSRSYKASKPIIIIIIRAFDRSKVLRPHLACKGSSTYRIAIFHSSINKLATSQMPAIIYEECKLPSFVLNQNLQAVNCIHCKAALERHQTGCTEHRVHRWCLARQWGGLQGLQWGIWLSITNELKPARLPAQGEFKQLSSELKHVGV